MMMFKLGASTHKSNTKASAVGAVASEKRDGFKFKWAQLGRRWFENEARERAVGTEMKERCVQVRRRGTGIGLRKSELTHWKSHHVSCWRSGHTRPCLPYSFFVEDISHPLSPAQPQSPISSCTYCAGIDFHQMNSTLVCDTMHYPRKTPTTFLL